MPSLISCGLISPCKQPERIHHASFVFCLYFGVDSPACIKPKNTAQPSRRASIIGDPLITHAEEEEGVPAAAAPLVVWLLAFSLASVWNVLYAVFLLWKNETWGRYTWMGWVDLVRKIRNVRARSSAICYAIWGVVPLGVCSFLFCVLCVLGVAAPWDSAGFPARITSSLRCISSSSSVPPPKLHDEVARGLPFAASTREAFLVALHTLTLPNHDQNTGDVASGCLVFLSDAPPPPHPVTLSCCCLLLHVPRARR